MIFTFSQLRSQICRFGHPLERKCKDSFVGHAVYFKANSGFAGESRSHGAENANFRQKALFLKSRFRPVSADSGGLFPLKSSSQQESVKIKVVQLDETNKMVGGEGLKLKSG